MSTQQDLDVYLAALGRLVAAIQGHEDRLCAELEDALSWVVNSPFPGLTGAPGIADNLERIGRRISDFAAKMAPPANRAGLAYGGIVTHTPTGAVGETTIADGPEVGRALRAAMQRQNHHADIREAVEWRATSADGWTCSDSILCTIRRAADEELSQQIAPLVAIVADDDGPRTMPLTAPANPAEAS